MTVSKRLRFEVLRRDNHTCRYCGGSAPDVKITVDHVTPIALGGTDHPENLVAACSDCNAGKTSMPADAELVADVEQDAIRWFQAMMRAKSEVMEHRLDLLNLAEDVTDAWDAWTYGPDNNRKPVPRAPDSVESIASWIERGVPDEVLISYIPAAMRKKKLRNGVDDTWPYYCGIINNVLKEITEKARGYFTEAVAEADGETSLSVNGAAWDEHVFAISDRGCIRMPSWLATAQQGWES